MLPMKRKPPVNDWLAWTPVYLAMLAGAMWDWVGPAVVVLVTSGIVVWLVAGALAAIAVFLLGR